MAKYIEFGFRNKKLLLPFSVALIQIIINIIVFLLNEKIKNPVFEIPTYEISGYEVGYINSNGKDYIFPSKEIEEKTSSYNFMSDASIVKNESDLFDTDRRQDSVWERDLQDKCNIPVD